MKKQTPTQVLWPSVLSLLTLGIFVLLALASNELHDIMHYDMKYLGNGVYEEMDYNFRDTAKYSYTKTTGKRDNKGRWQGPVIIYFSGEHKNDPDRREEVTMVDGKRHGICKITWNGELGQKWEDTKCYNMGVEVYCMKSTESGQSGSSAYQILGNEYSWYFFRLICFGFDSTYVESYLDTLETLLYAYEFEEDEFDSYYSDVQDSLRNTPYDSILTLQASLLMFQGITEIKNAEFRLAVIDHYRLDGKPTHEIIAETYPGYLQKMVGMGIPEEDFEQFCRDVDDSLASYGPLDPEDPFYVDSIDSYLFNAFEGIMGRDRKSTLVSGLKFAAGPESSSGIAQNVALDMRSLFNLGDINRRVVLEAWQLLKGIVSLPVVTTEFAGNTSATSVHLQGYVIEDGGDGVTDRGIAWAESYNPTVFDNIQASGSGTGTFAITLDGLTEGKTYYARSYATNSAGTAYGNCISFVASVPTSLPGELTGPPLTLYPNPASAFARCTFTVVLPGIADLIIVDMKGQRVFHKKLRQLPAGAQHVLLDLSGLKPGTYQVQLLNGRNKSTQKLVIARQD